MAQKQNPPTLGREQRLYLIEMIREQLDILQTQLGLLQTNKEGLSLTLNTLQGLKDNYEKDQEVIVPLGRNAYTKARLIDPNKVMIFIKEDMVITKSLDDGIKSLSEMLAENERVQNMLISRMNDLRNQLNALAGQPPSNYPRVDVSM